MREGTDACGAISVTDVMIAGDVLRVAHGGLPELRGPDVADSLADLRARHERLRSFLNEPPHGNELVNACLLYPASNASRAGRHFLASRFGFSPFAGTALMACATVRALQGSPLPRDGTPLVFETARGLAEVEVQSDGPLSARATWIASVPSVPIADHLIDLPGRGMVRLSIVMSGLPYIVVEDRELGVSIDAVPELARAAMELGAAVEREWPVARFGFGDDHAHFLMMVISLSDKEEVRVVWVSDRGEAARSAGGTGALAVLGALEARGLRPRGRAVPIRAPGGSFSCRIDNDAASVTADARIVARHDFFYAGQLDQPLR
jgi:proline racemase